MRSRIGRTRTTSLRLLAVVLAGVCVLAGCSGGDEGGSTTLKVGQATDSIGFFPIFVASHEGFFDEEGVDVPEVLIMNGGANTVAGVTSGSLDVGADVMTDVYSMVQAGRPVTAVGRLINGYYVDIIAGSALMESSGVSPESSLDEKVAALKGAKIGITSPGSGTEALVTYVFDQAGLDAQRDATLVSVGGDSTAALAALKSGRIDALSWAINGSAAAEAAGIGKALISPVRGDIPALEGQVHGVLYAQPSVVQDKAAAFRGFVRAIARADDLIRNQPDTARELLGSYMKGVPPEALDLLAENFKTYFPEDPTITQQGYETALDFHVKTGLVDDAGGDAYSYGEVVDEEMISSALSGD